MSHGNGIDIGAATHAGYVREENQDYQGVFETPLGRLLVVADGMGGHKGGALAAQLTVQALQQTFNTSSPVEEVIQEAFNNANSQVYRRATAGDEATEGMGSTALALLLSDDRAWIAHVGDSRAYLMRDGRMTRLTKDHTRVQRMVDVGILTEEEARVHPDGNLLDRAMGHSPAIEIALSSHRLMAGDAVLLCTDGLWAYATEIEIEQVLSRPGTAQQLCDQLVQMALDHGGEDNITVQLLRMGVTTESVANNQGRVTRKLPQNLYTPTPNTNRRKRHLLYSIVVTIAILAGITLWPHDEPLQAPHQTVNVPTPGNGKTSEQPTDKTEADVKESSGPQQGQVSDKPLPAAETAAPDAKEPTDTNQVQAGGGDTRGRSGTPKEATSADKPPPTDTPPEGGNRPGLSRDQQHSAPTPGAAGTTTPDN
jgi:serine/threonine protein phosphatase PrpC